MTISEEKLTQIVRTRKSRHEQTVFDGVIVILSMNKKFKGQTVVKKTTAGWETNLPVLQACNGCGWKTRFLNVSLKSIPITRLKPVIC